MSLPAPPATGNGVWIMPAANLIHEDFLGLFLAHGFSIGNAMLFYRPAMTVDTEAHVDIIPRNPEKCVASAINIVIGGNGSTMRWYDLPTDSREIRWTRAKTPYLSWPITSLEELDRCPIGLSPILTRVDRPHAVFVGDHERWCVSMRFSSSFGSWDSAVERLSAAGLVCNRGASEI